MFDNFNVNLRKNEGFPTCIPCTPIPEYGQSNAPQVFRDYSILYILYNMCEVSYNWIGVDGFELKSETERLTVVCPRCRQNLKFGYFT